MPQNADQRIKQLIEALVKRDGFEKTIRLLVEIKSKNYHKFLDYIEEKSLQNDSE